MLHHWQEDVVLHQILSACLTKIVLTIQQRGETLLTGATEAVGYYTLISSRESGLILQNVRRDAYKRKGSADSLAAVCNSHLHPEQMACCSHSPNSYRWKMHLHSLLPLPGVLRQKKPATSFPSPSKSLSDLQCKEHQCILKLKWKPNRPTTKQTPSQCLCEDGH